jgi:hypothetical protein
MSRSEAGRVQLALSVCALLLAQACGDDDAALAAVSAAGAGGAPVAPPSAGQAQAGAAAGTMSAAAAANGGSRAEPGAMVPGAAGASGAVAGSSGAAAVPGAGGSGGAAGSSGAGPVPGPGSAGASGSDTCSDSCAYGKGVSWLCKLRFMYGVNYAWHTFGGDFGGIEAWNQKGVSEEPLVASELATMASQGVNVIRWWLWPDFRGNGVSFDAADNPTGLGGSALADIARALELAEQHDLYIMLTLFSFDGFRPTRDEGTLRVRSITPLVVDADKRKLLMDNVVAKLAMAVAASPHAKRMISWDVINEPEWAISGASLYGGDPVFDPMEELSTVSHAQMETFARDVITTLRAHSKALISVGGTAIKWRHAWSMLDTDYHQFHIYDWVNQYWPYSQTTASYGIDDKPVVMGEFPLAGLSGVPYATLLQSWYESGYAGALGWAYTDPMSGNRDLTEVQAFASKYPCESQF